MNKKIKVLIVNPSANLGGGNTISNNLAIGLDKNFFEVYSFFPEEGPAVSILKKTSNITILISPRPNLFSILSFLFNFLNKNKIDIIHAQGTRAAFWVKIAFLFLKTRPKLIYTLHGLHIAHQPFWQKYPLLCLEKTSNILVEKLVCPSLSVKSLAEKYKIIKSSKIKLIYHGINIQNFNTALPFDKRSLNIPEDYLVISAIQRLNFPKDVSTILYAFKKVKESLRDTVLLVVGSGPLMRKLQGEAQEISIAESVLFLGDRQDIPNILATSDIVILSSAFEALGLSLIEAMAAKKAVIGAKVDGIKEIVENGKNGFLVELRNEKKMAEAILLLLSDSKLCQKMGENGFEFVKAKFPLEKMLQNYQELYTSILR
jgi:glycosyltransferase involved in cell wall biosynthesis